MSSRKVRIDVDTEAVVKKALVNRLYHEIDDLNERISTLERELKSAKASFSYATRVIV